MTEFAPGPVSLPSKLALLQRALQEPVENRPTPNTVTAQSQNDDVIINLSSQGRRSNSEAENNNRGTYQRGAEYRAFPPRTTGQRLLTAMIDAMAGDTVLEKLGQQIDEYV